MAEKEYVAKEFVIDAIEELKTKPMPKALLFDHLTKLIEIFPTEDFAPVRHGEWQEISGIFRCSRCRYSFEHEGYQHFFNFCPNCGAKMFGGEEK